MVLMVFFESSPGALGGPPSISPPVDASQNDGLGERPVFRTQWSSGTFDVRYRAKGTVNFRPDEMISDAAQVSLARENPQMIVDLTNAGSPLGSDPKFVLFFLSADDAPKIDSTVVNDDVDHGAYLTQIIFDITDSRKASSASKRSKNCNP
jgi:hypothetical protein